MRICESPCVCQCGMGAVLPGGGSGTSSSKWKPCSKRVMSIGSIIGGAEGFWSGDVTAKTWEGIWASRETCILNVAPIASGLSGTVG